MEGSKTAEFCAEHKKEGMVNVKNKECGLPCCTKYALYCVEGGKTAKFCADHKKEGMVRRWSGRVFVGNNRNGGDATGPGSSAISRTKSGVGEARKRPANDPLQAQAEFFSASKHAKRSRQMATNVATHEAARARPLHGEGGSSLGQYPAAVKVDERAMLSAFGTAEAVRRTTSGDKRRHRAGVAAKISSKP